MRPSEEVHRIDDTDECDADVNHAPTPK